MRAWQKRDADHRNAENYVDASPKLSCWTALVNTEYFPEGCSFFPIEGVESEVVSDIAPGSPAPG
jgi:hypothetical protein